jgi:hypothetical protein
MNLPPSLKDKKPAVCLALALSLLLQGPVLAAKKPPASRPGREAILPPPTAPEDARDLPTTDARFRYPPFLIGPGDLLSVFVYGEKDLPTSFLVDSAGTIVFPPIGAIDVGGLTQVEASKVLAAGLAKYMKEPQVTVMVAESSQYTVAIMGEVQKPGKYLIRGMPTLLGVLSEAGGPLPHAALGGAKLIRNNRTYELSLLPYLKTRKEPRPQPVLFPGDILYLPGSGVPSLADWGIIVSILSSVAVLYMLGRSEVQRMD